MDFESALVELYRLMATDLSPDMDSAMKRALSEEEPDTIASKALGIICENIRLARDECQPMCQDTGTPIIFVEAPEGESTIKFREILTNATRRATKEIPLRPNAVDIVTSKNTGDNVGEHIPIIYFEHWDKPYWRIQGLMKGGGSENVGDRYKLPDKALNAGRNLDGIRKCVIDAVFKSQGMGCPPYVAGIGIAGMKDQASWRAKRALLRPGSERNPNPEIAALELLLMEELNQLGIGPIGAGGKNTVLWVAIDGFHRHPATFFVDVTMMCWANRKCTMEWDGKEAKYIRGT